MKRKQYDLKFLKEESKEVFLQSVDLVDWGTIEFVCKTKNNTITHKTFFGNYNMLQNLLVEYAKENEVTIISESKTNNFDEFLWACEDKYLQLDDLSNTNKYKVKHELVYYANLLTEIFSVNCKSSTNTKKIKKYINLSYFIPKSEWKNIAYRIN